jgi:tetratricopeptide (TPR) repeat protein
MSGKNHAGEQLPQERSSESDFTCEVERLNDLISRLWEANPDDVEIPKQLRSLGSYYVLQGAYSEASYVFKRMRQLISRHYGPYDLQVVEAMDWEGVLDILQGAPLAAEESLRNALAILSEGPFPALSLRAKLLLHLGHVLIEKANYLEAEERLKQAASFQLYWLKTGLAATDDRSLLCDIMVTLRRLFVLTERPEQVKEIDQIFVNNPGRAQSFDSIGLYRRNVA